MKSETYFFRTFLPGVYALFFMAAMAFLVVMAKETPFCGIYVILVTMPWSSMMLSVGTAAASPTVGGIPIVPVLIILVSAVLNGTVLYFAGGLVDQMFHGFSKAANDPKDESPNT